MIARTLTLALAFVAGLMARDVLAPAHAGHRDAPDDDVLTEIYAHVRDHYVEPVDGARLVDGAVRGMLGVLDPHTTWFDPQALADFRAANRGELQGIGVELSARDAHIMVVAPLPDSPASGAGLRRGDVLTTIDGHPLDGLPLAEVARRLRGPAGSTLRLGWQRAGAPHQATLTRARLHIEPVMAALLPGRVAHLAVRVFQQDTAERLAAAHARLRAEAGALRGVVLDLRDDPGGLVTEAVEVADLFLAGGKVVETRGRSRRRAWRARRKVTIAEPTVVLINGGTASAAEIVAGALRARAKTPLIGAQSFGKGSVQTIFELGDGSGLKLTIARYFTPDGTPIDGVGLRPDVVVPESGPVRRPGDATRPQTDPTLRRALAWLDGERADKEDAPR